MVQTKHRSDRQSKHHNGRPGSAEAFEEEPVSAHSFLRRFWFEIWAFCLFATGIFLLVERLQIKLTVWRWLVSSFRGTLGFLRYLRDSITSLLGRVEVSDIVGIGLIAVAVGMLVYGMRARAIARSSPLTDGSECPGSKCEGVVRRSRKTFCDRLTQTVLRVSVRPYSCRDCSFRCVVWKGFGDPS